MHHTVTYTGCFDIREGANSVSFFGIKGGEGLAKKYIISHANTEEIEIGPKAKPPAIGQTIIVTYPQENESFGG